MVKFFLMIGTDDVISAVVPNMAVQWVLLFWVWIPTIVSDLFHYFLQSLLATSFHILFSWSLTHNHHGVRHLVVAYITYAVDTVSLNRRTIDSIDPTIVIKSQNHINLSFVVNLQNQPMTTT
jgi:hypothetical protein